MTRRSRQHPSRNVLRIGFALVVATVALRWWLGPSGEAERTRILDAIRMVESSDSAHPPDGDDGAAIGPYQIHLVYWQDAIEAEPALGGTYQDCRDRAYAERVIGAYMRRFAPEAWAKADAEIIARTHNGGPQGASKPTTDGYWLKVRSQLH